jgi:hypothetical protein
LTGFLFGTQSHLIKFTDYGALVVAASPPRVPGSGHRRSYDCPTEHSKSIFGEFQPFGSPVFFETIPTATEYMRQPDVSPPIDFSSQRAVVEPASSAVTLNAHSPNRRRMGVSVIYSALQQHQHIATNHSMTHAPVSPALDSPGLKRKMGLSTMFRQ